MHLAAVTMSPPLREDADGILRVGDTRVTLQTLVAAYEQGSSAEEIALRYPTLALDQVYASIGFYLGHRDELRDYLATEEQASTRARADSDQRPSVLAVRERLRGARSGR